VSRYGSIDSAEIQLLHQPVSTLHVGGGAMILDRQVTGELGYILDARYSAHSEDLDLGLRLDCLGYRVVFVPTAVYCDHREGRTQVLQKTLRRAEMATGNRMLAYMKNMSADEFLLALTLLFLGSDTKMRRAVAGRHKKSMYTLASVPFNV
jgi:GT2 family glycosyltransferase